MDAGNIIFILMPLLFICIGLYLFFSSFKKFREKRLVEDTPTSTIRGLSMGIVEVMGKAKGAYVLQGPFTHKPCVFYKYLIEEYREEGDSKRWMPGASGDSSFIPFLVEDETGEMLILPNGADFLLPEDFTYTTQNYTSLPENVRRFSQTFASVWDDIVRRGHICRFREWIIEEDDSVYILGYARKLANISAGYRNNSRHLRRNMESDPFTKVFYDTDKDGRISEMDLRHIGARIVSEMQNLPLSGRENGDVSDVVIASHEKGTPFIISDQSQKGVGMRLKHMFINKMIAGIIIIMVGLFFVDKAFKALF